ncbi:hypothetical protein [Pleionea litopenaei]|uniref:Uncharacterized protein n=1 Tax=Pleionea litopenaei TaxID=3070815 RepID=A0AA51X7X8_9GAMM|nr:hypothetical protein [Pleionea sp. HL-JVS1]WMS88792.1 hypothetical protein Q9312_07700 [Pleionea sp. HL-JVS1]
MKYQLLIFAIIAILNVKASDKAAFSVFGRSIALTGDCSISAEKSLRDKQIFVDCGNPTVGPKGFIVLEEKTDDAGDFTSLEGVSSLKVVKSDSLSIDGFEHYSLELFNESGSYYYYALCNDRYCLKVGSSYKEFVRTAISEIAKDNLYDKSESEA